MIDGGHEVHHMEHQGLIHINNIGRILVGFVDDGTNVLKELEGLALNLTRMTLGLVGGHAMDEAVLQHKAGDRHLYHMFRLCFQHGNNTRAFRISAMRFTGRPLECQESTKSSSSCVISMRTPTGSKCRDDASGQVIDARA
jgi:hypothetical protein